MLFSKRARYFLFRDRETTRTSLPRDKVVAHTAERLTWIFLDMNCTTSSMKNHPYSHNQVKDKRNYPDPSFTTLFFGVLPCSRNASASCYQPSRRYHYPNTLIGTWRPNGKSAYCLSPWLPEPNLIGKSSPYRGESRTFSIIKSFFPVV